MEKTERITDIHRFLAGDMSAVEESAFRQWLNADVQNHQYFKEIKEVWELSLDYQTPSFDVDRAMESMDLAEPDSTRAGRRILPMRWAAAVIVAVAGIWLVIEMTSGPEMIYTRATEAELITLEDGTAVHLNEGAQLIYPELFRGKERHVTLTGEAVFDVKSDEQMPFVIDGGVAEITVLGTKFGVDVNDTAGIVLVQVVEGNVRIQPALSQKYLDVEAGKAVLYDDSAGVLKRLKNSSFNSLAWSTGKLSFIDTPLSQVIRDLEDTYGTEIILERASLADCPFTSPLPFEHQTVEQIIQAVARVFRMTIDKADGVIRLRGGTCGER